MPSTRRRLLAASALFGLAIPATARTLKEALPWSPNEAYPPERVVPGPWVFFTAGEAATVEAIADRVIPADELGPGGKEAGCAVFIDRQLAGPYGTSAWLYMRPPFARGTPSQGLQDEDPPAVQYRKGLGALTSYCTGRYGGRRFEALTPQQQDEVLTAMEKGEAKDPGADLRGFFEQLLNNMTEGFFADPIYGGNKDMCGWRLLGFPGTRYDYREVIAAPNQKYTLPPVALTGRPEWMR
ncbi:gluconate 2-dehydrogenase subunit 3 family protein [Belnapia sp. T6]|uniref:Gluconate 2-dehydrogenase subunit 3 family protein n=1 Tax=Belnapia mucosa TaxID=2804532 RepID=A0ABS1V192_9PROT|nr:gluconate 2-dehydrogenase subunit 3 family protein [Belnapia mucosa]MBL6455460.1 gluconate 2-dehydrogenase subunit 3 family protein [Belnapia mucosa]